MFDGRGIGFNPRYYSEKGAMSGSLEASVASDVRSRWHPEGTGDIGSIGVHEFGHSVDGFLSGYNLKVSVWVPTKLNPDGTVAEHGHYVSEAMPAMSKSWLNAVHVKLKKSSTDVSRYANKNGEEAYAEAFAQWFSSEMGLPGSVPYDQLSPHAKAVGEFMKSFPPETWDPKNPPLPQSAAPGEEVSATANTIEELMGVAHENRLAQIRAESAARRR
jgi:hypothetical protein